MLFLLVFAFVAGIITILSPCILPLLPIILSSTYGKGRPFGVVTGFVLSFTFFTLFLSTLVQFLNVPADILRNVSVGIIGFFGLTLLFPQAQYLIEKLFTILTSRFSKRNTTSIQSGFSGGVIVGLSLGLLWTPCVGPILASVISLAIQGTVTFETFAITASYALGTALPMFLIMIGGQQALKKVPWLVQNLPSIQKLFGALMILTALAIYFGFDRQFQNFILSSFPDYSDQITKIENNTNVIEELGNINK